NAMTRSRQRVITACAGILLVVPLTTEADAFRLPSFHIPAIRAPVLRMPAARMPHVAPRVSGVHAPRLSGAHTSRFSSRMTGSRFSRASKVHRQSYAHKGSGAGKQKFQTASVHRPPSRTTAAQTRRPQTASKSQQPMPGNWLDCNRTGGVWGHKGDCGAP